MRYPRPTSPLSYEPVQPTAGDVIYEPGSSSEEDLEVRQSKRRRIEELGTSYLQGYPVMIMTAQLKGPFEGIHNGKRVKWRNPWRKRQTSRNGSGAAVATRALESEAVIPETAWKDRHPGDAAKGISSEDMIMEHKGGETDEKNVQVLRRDRNFSTSNNNGSQRSPTPAGPRGTRHISAFQDNNHKSSYKGPSEIAVKGTVTRETAADDAREKRIMVDTDEQFRDDEYHSAQERQAEHIIDPVDHTQKIKVSCVGKSWVLHNAAMDDPRAQTRNMAKARKARRMDFASPSAVTSHNEKNEQTTGSLLTSSPYTVTTRTVTGLEGHLKADISAKYLEEDVKTMQKANNPSEPSCERRRSIGEKQDLKVLNEASTEPEATNHGPVLSEIPSAQIDPQPIPHLHEPSTASITTLPEIGNPSVSDKREDSVAKPPEESPTAEDDSVLLLSTQAGVCRAQQQLRADLLVSDRGDPAANTITTDEQDNLRNKDGIRLFKDIGMSSTPSPETGRRFQNIAHDPDTQAMLEAITPFTLTTTKKVPLKFSSPKDLTPTLGSKGKKKKRASFAPTSQESTSSSGSLKCSLKVTKSASATTTPKPLEGDGNKKVKSLKDSLQKEHGSGNFHGTEESLPSLKKLLNAHQPPSLIPTSSTAPFTPTNHTENAMQLHEEAYGQNALDDNHEAAFDLSAAMHDMGSFLQSWNPDEIQALGPLPNPPYNRLTRSSGPPND
ncbi:hypothetical protein UCRPC4_g01097 [Phaeomoniella chlamydospora]|uniref:Uncharacterized protein n=1 Tax=Phaeomoniella chlamydospora TaxID=158046 RepID=A0A0G2EY22_PHACM|nr:hypothetical protein UCRPC4_g01097 [Phaeomoniella chlamydospora]